MAAYICQQINAYDLQLLITNDSDNEDNWDFNAHANQCINGESRDNTTLHGLKEKGGDKTSIRDLKTERVVGDIAILMKS